MSDFKAQFKAAKASRGTGASTKLVCLPSTDDAESNIGIDFQNFHQVIMACMQSKEQLKALKAQRAAAEAKAAEDAGKQAAKQVGFSYSLAFFTSYASSSKWHRSDQHRAQATAAAMYP